MLEAQRRNNESPLGWANFAAAAIGDTLSVSTNPANARQRLLQQQGLQLGPARGQTLVYGVMALGVNAKFGEEAAELLRRGAGRHRGLGAGGKEELGEHLFGPRQQRRLARNGGATGRRQ